MCTQMTIVYTSHVNKKNDDINNWQEDLLSFTLQSIFITDKTNTDNKVGGCLLWRHSSIIEDLLVGKYA